MDGGRFLVTGGAGYVGSHVVLALLDRGAEVVVVDDLRQGHREAVPPGVRLVEADIAAAADEVLADGPWTAVLHFAALSLVGESVRQPMRYMRENAASGIILIESCVRHGVTRFVLSSTANLFGEPERTPIAEDARLQPSSPYGQSKLVLEQTLRLAAAEGLNSACLRYFNAAGADPAGRLGEDHNPETHLIPLVIDAALGRRPELAVFGTDYPTPDGTCIRDYVHVCDLAEAHLLALGRLDGCGGGDGTAGSIAYNLGNGQGHSVLDVIRAVERVIGRRVPVRFEGRRPGDPAVLVASAGRIQCETGWTPRFAALDDIVRTAAEWRIRHPQGYQTVRSSPPAAA